MSSPFAFFVTCPFGSEHVAHSDLAALLGQYTCDPAAAAEAVAGDQNNRVVGSNWFALEPVSNCRTRAHGPPLPYTALKLSFNAKGGLSGTAARRFAAFKDRNEEDYAKAKATTVVTNKKKKSKGSDDSTSVTDDVAGKTEDEASKKRQRSPTTPSSTVAAPEGSSPTSSKPSRHVFLPAEAIAALNYGVLIGGGSSTEGTDEGTDEKFVTRVEAGGESKGGVEEGKLTSFRGSVTFRFLVPMDTPLVRRRTAKKEGEQQQATEGGTATSTTPRRLLLEAIYFLRSIGGVFIHLASSAPSALGDDAAALPPLVRYDPFAPIEQQQSLAAFVDNDLFASAEGDQKQMKDKNKMSSSRWDAMIEEVNAIRTACVAANACPALAETTRPLLLAPLLTAAPSNSDGTAVTSSSSSSFPSSHSLFEESPDSIVLFRVSCARFDKTQTDGQIATSNGYATSAPSASSGKGGKKKASTKTDSAADGNNAATPKEKGKVFVKASSADIARHLGGLIGTRLCPETDDDLLAAAVSPQQKGEDGIAPSASSPQTLPPLPRRPHRASMLYHSVEVHCLHDFDRALVGVCLHDANVPRVDKEGDRPFAETSGVLLKQRNDGRAAVAAALLPAAVAARAAYRRAHHGGESASDDNADAPTVAAAVAPYRQPPMARPSSFKHDVRISKGDNSMNPALASLMAWHTFAGSETYNNQPIKSTTNNDCSNTSSSDEANAFVNVQAVLPQLRASSMASSASNAQRRSRPFTVVDPLGGTGTTIIEAFLRSASLLTAAGDDDESREEGAASPLPPIVGFAGDLRLSEARPMGSNFAEANLRAQMAAFGLQTSAAANAEAVNNSSGGAANKTLRVAHHSEGRLFPLMAAAAHWDATRLPFADGGVDAILSDLPFGRRCGNASVNDQLYVQLLLEFYRVLSPAASTDGINQSDAPSTSRKSPPTGRCVLLTIERKLMITALVEAAVKGAPFRVLERPFMVDMGGLMPYVFVLERAERI